jgi:hypothetical protein
MEDALSRKMALEQKRDILCILVVITLHAILPALNLVF